MMRMLSTILCLAITCYWQTSHAFTWKDLWWRADQQAMQHFNHNEYQRAAEQFTLPRWKGVAAYRVEDYHTAFEQFGQGNDAISFYNRGNALALMGDFSGAITAYDQAIKQKPDFEDAIFNRDLLKKLKQQQQDQQPSQQPQAKNNQPMPQPQPMANNSNNDAPEEDKMNQQASAAPQPQDSHDPQWLKRIDDDPGSLLKQKFLRDHQRYQQERYPS